MPLSARLGSAVTFAKLIGASGVWRHAVTLRVGRLWRAWAAARHHGASPDRFVAVMAALRGDEVCVIEERGAAWASAASQASEAWTWHALHAEIARWAGALREHGVAAGDRVALGLPNGAALLIGQFAVARIGGVAMPLGMQLRPAEIAGALATATPRLAIVDAAAQDVWHAAVALGLGPAPIIWRADQLPSSLRSAHAKAIAPASSGGLLIFTSGTTGNAKGAHRAWDASGYASVVDLMQRMGVRADDRQLVVCPMYHSAAPAFAQMTLALGGQCVIMRQWDTAAVLDAIVRHRITGIFVVPTMLQRLVDAVADSPVIGQRLARSLRWVLCGAAPLAPSLAKQAIGALGPIVWNFYGATETGVVSLAAPRELLARPGTVGRLLTGNAARLLVNEGGARREAAPGEMGELYIHNGQLVAGYWQNEAATAGARDQGYVTVGDLARFDAAGYLYLEGRVREVIISGGVNIYPQEIEAVLAAHPAIAEAAVVGIPNDEWGEQVAAAVVARTALTQADVIAWCRQHLADFKRPRRVVFLEALPRNALGKVEKRTQLVGMLAGGEVLSNRNGEGGA